jgi:NAD+ kinase
MKIGILAKTSKVKSESVIDQFIDSIQSNGYDTKRFVSPSEIDGVDVVIVLGGDGAILHAAVVASRKNIKIIGINYGNLGFLAEYEKDETDKILALLADLKENRCRILKRSMLQCTIGNKTFYALNEIALQRDSSLSAIKFPQIVRLEVTTQEGFNEIAGDGLLVSTPTGSTAYSLSAGGAIITPEVPVFMLTPICAFSMRTRPIVFSDNEVFAVRVKRGKAIVSVDGCSMSALSENATVIIQKAPFTADFPISSNLDFFTKVKNKLSE